MPELLTWLMPPAVLAAGVWRPRAGLLVLAAALPLFGSPPGGPYLAAFDLAALAAVVTAWRAGPAPRSRLDLPVLALALASLASMAPALYRPPSWQPRSLAGLLAELPGAESWSALYSWRAALDLALGVALFVAVRRAFAGRSPRALGVALAAGMAAVLAVGLAAHLGWLELWAWRPVGEPWLDERLHALFFHSGWLAEYLVMAAPVAVAALAGAGRRGRGAALALAALAGVALVLTLQRGAWIAAAVQLAVAVALAGPLAAWRSPRARRRLAVGAGAVALVAVSLWALRPAVLGPVVSRAREIAEAGGRPAVWRATAVMMWDRPALGWGLGAFVPAWEEREMSRVARRVGWLTPHNHYLAVAVERGALGLAAFAWLAWALAGALGAGLRSADRDRRLLARGLAVALVGAAVHGVVQYLFFVKAIQWLFWIVAGSVAALAPAAPASRRRRRAAAALVVAAVAVAAWRASALAPVTSASSASYGFHRPEGRRGQPFEWTTARAARRLPWRDAALVVTVANGHPRAAERPVEVTLSVDGRRLDSFTLSEPDRWQERCLAVGPPAAGSLVLEIEARPAFRPFRDFLRHPDLERSRDIRLLGVAVQPVRWGGAGPPGPC